MAKSKSSTNGVPAPAGTTATPSTTPRPTLACPVIESYRHPDDHSETSLRYFVSKSGKHTVLHDVPIHWGVAPSVWRYDEIAEARVQWRKLREELAELGYVRVK